MQAAVLEKFGGLDSLVIKDIPEPEPEAGYVVIEIKAFDLIPFRCSAAVVVPVWLVGSADSPRFRTSTHFCKWRVVST